MVNTEKQPSTKNQVQTLIVPDDKQEDYIELGLKCVTPGLPRERLDEETQKEVEKVVQEQTLQIKTRGNTNPAHEEKENVDSSFDEGEEIGDISPNEADTGNKPESKNSLKRDRQPAALDLNKQPEYFTKKIKVDKNTIQTAAEAKPHVSIKYVGYNQTPQYYQQAPYSVGTYYNYPGYYQGDYMMMHQQLLLQQQMNYMNQSSAHGHQGETMMNGYPTYITPLTNQNPYGNPAQYVGRQQIYQPPMAQTQDEETHTDKFDFQGVISINNDSFKFEFNTNPEETIGKLQTEINDLNREKFLKICEKTWNESYWLMKKREQYSNPTPAGLSADREVKHEDKVEGNGSEESEEDESNSESSEVDQN
ncbi:hypothetical protein ACO0R3_002432 [Hanseniaspora guilliermondii]